MLFIPLTIALCWAVTVGLQGMLGRRMRWLVGA
jgi:hypothetical protein